MFRDVYHQANCDIPVNQELLEKLLTKKPKKNNFFYPQAAVVAGILILSASVLAYPKIKNNPTGGIITPFSTLPPAAVVTPTAPNPIPDFQTENNGTHATNIQNSERADTSQNMPAKPTPKAKRNSLPKASAPSSQTKNGKTTVPQSSQAGINLSEGAGDTTQPVAIGQTPDAAHSTEVGQTSDTAQSSTTAQTSDMTPSETLAQTSGMTQSSSIGQMPDVQQPTVLGQTSDTLTHASFITEEWTKERYFDYLGKIIDPVLPSDLVDISVTTKNMTLYKETGLPCLDTWSWKYESSDQARYAVVKTTKKVAEAEANIANADHYIEINDVKILLTTENSSYLAQAIQGDVSYTIETTGLSEEEFNTLCLSVLK